MDQSVDAQKIRQLLKKTKHFDKDERFMATSDLNRELEGIEGQLSGGLQRPIRDAILGQLDDTSNDVQAIACRCLATCARKFNVEQVDEIVEKVATLLISGRAELRDIYCIALKTIIKSVVDEYGHTISKTLSLVLLEGLTRAINLERNLTEKEKKQKKRDDYECRIMCMDITKDLIVRFGAKMAQSHKNIQEVVEPYLGNNDRELRKKAAATLGALVPVMTTDQFSGIFESVLGRINDLSQRNTDTEILFTYIQCIGIFSRNAGQRVEPHLDAIMKNLFVFSDPAELKVEESIKHELLENTLQAFESIVLQCPSRFSLESEDSKRYGREIFDIALKLIKYDPLYNYDVADIGDENEEGDFEDDGMGWEDDDEGGWDDDEDNLVVEEEDDADDTSWKVRVAATKCMNGLIRSKAQSIHLVADKLMKVLLIQFREHDQNVKNEVFGAFRELLMATAVSEGAAAVTGKQMDESDPLALPPMFRHKTSSEVVDEYVQQIMDQIIIQLKTENVKTKTGILGVLRELVLVRQAVRSHRSKQVSRAGLSPYFPELIPQLAKCMGDNDIVVRQKSLRVLYLIINLHDSVYIRPIIPQICPVLEKCTSTDTYNTRVKTQALLVISQLIKTMRDPKTASDYDKKYDPYLLALFEAAFGQLKIRDIEQEVKKAAIAAAADCLAWFGDVLDSKDVNNTLEILIERLDNAITQDAALRAFAIIASSPLQIDLSKITNKVIQNVEYSMAKQSQGLRHQTMVTLIALLRNSGRMLRPDVLPQLIKDCSQYVVDEDLHLCHLILDMIVVTMKVSERSLAAVTNFTLQNCFELCASPLIQGQALRSLKNLFRTYQRIGRGKFMVYGRLKRALMDVCQKEVSKQSFTAISQCVASISMEVDGKTIDDSIHQLRANINKKEAWVSQISLLCIGEIGNFRNLRQHKGLLVDVFGAFKSQNEVVKWAASFALGRMASGSLDTFLPTVLKLIDSNPDKAYLLLSSLKEIVTAHSDEDEKSNSLLKYVPEVLPLLMNSAESEDEGVRTMVAECIGKFAYIDPEILSRIKYSMGTTNYVKRSTMVAALKFALSKNMEFEIPKETIQMFFKVLNDDTLESTLQKIKGDGNENEAMAKSYDLAMQLVPVRKQALQTLNALIHTQPQICLDFLSDRVLPKIYSSLPIEAKLQRSVDLGPFKHLVDSHLQIRKSAYQCMDTILESYEYKTLNAAKPGFEGYINALQNGVTDTSDDIQILTVQIFTRLCQQYAHEVLPFLDGLLPSFTKGVTGKLSILKRARTDEKTAKDADRARDVLRIFTKCLWTMNNLPGLQKEAPKFAAFWPRVTKTKDLIPIIEELNSVRNS